MKSSRFSTNAFQAIRYAFISVSSSTWRFADMVNNKSSGIHACMKCHLTSISIDTIVEMVIFYFQCTLYLQNITFVRFWNKIISLCLVYRTMHSSSLFITCVRFRNKKFRPQSCCTCVNITSVRFISQVIFIQKGSCREISYIFAKVIPFSKSLLFSRVSKHPSATIFKWFIHKLQNTHPFSPLNIPQIAENQGFLESRQTVSIFPWTLILYCIAKACNRFSKWGNIFSPFEIPPPIII